MKKLNIVKIKSSNSGYTRTRAFCTNYLHKEGVGNEKNKLYYASYGYRFSRY